MKPPRFSHSANLFVVFLFLTNIILLLGTWLFHYYYYQRIEGRWEEASGIKYLIRELSLGTENTLATWYSSMLFLLVAVMSLVCYFIQRQTSGARKSKFLSLGWIMFFLIFSLLSFDEIASIHERLGNLAVLNPMGDDPPGWVYLLGVPIAVVGIIMLFFCRMLIKHSPWAAGIAVTGILLFLTIPIQEYFEMQTWDAAPDRDEWMRPVQFLLMEEGFEILGVSLMLLATMIYAIRLSGSRKIHEILREEFRKNKKLIILSVSTGCVLLAFPMIISYPLNSEGENGIVKNWFPAATAFIGSLCSLYVYYYRTATSHPSHRRIYIILALFCLFLSAYFGSDMYSHFHHLQEQWLKIIFSLIIFPVILVLAYRRFIYNHKFSGRIRIFAWAILLIIAISLSNSYSAFIAYVALSIFVYSLCLRILSTEHKKDKQPV